MKTYSLSIKPLCLLVLLVSTLNSPLSTFAQGNAFTYQGRLTSGTNVANGNYDLRFNLFDQSSGPNLPVAGPITTTNVGVTNGLFTVAVDFGANFPGADRWLEIGVRTNNGGAFTTLNPRQKITPAPYAITAGNVTGVVPNGGLSGTYTAAVTLNNAANSFTGNGGGLTNVNALTLGGLSGSNFWKTGGNAGANPTNNNFLGTTDNLPLELKVNNVRALRLEPNADGAPNVIGGAPINFVSAGSVGVTISGGGASNYAGIGLALSNSVSSSFGTVAGGVVNTIQTNSFASSIGGGSKNTNTGPYGVVPGGDQNVAGANSLAAGHRAKATNQGAFVWADSTEANFASTANNQFLIRATGGVGIGTNNPQSALHVAGTVTAANFLSSAAGVEPPSGISPILNMVWIVPGTFIMGSPSSEPDRLSNEGPQTVVTLTKGFWIGHHEVTQGEYQSLMNTNPSYFTGNLSLPVEQVSWNDATNFCGTLTLRELGAGRLPSGWLYRLPTEAEWEYACRALTTTRFYYGDDLTYSSLTNYAWYGGGFGGTGNGGGTTHPVAQKIANPWGLVDMHGNVFEWCKDWYSTYLGGSGVDPQGPGTGTYRVVRSNGWAPEGRYQRSAERSFAVPTLADFQGGFRVVLAPN